MRKDERRVDRVERSVGDGGEKGVLYCNFFFNDTATTEIYTLSLHDALPIYIRFCVVEFQQEK